MSVQEIEALNRDLMPGLYEDDDLDLSTLDRGDDPGEPEQESAPVDAPETEVTEEPEAEQEVAEEEPEEEPEEEEEPQAQEPKKKILIPKSRLDDEIAKRRKLEVDLAELKKKHQEAETTQAQDEAFEAATKEASALLRQANEAVLDGELDKAAELQQQALLKMSAANKVTHTQEIDTEAIYSQIEAKLELKHTIKEIYEKYPEFDHKSESADSELIERAVMYEKMYAEMGHTPAEAVRRAVEDTLKILAPEKLAPKAAPVVKKSVRDTSNLASKISTAKKAPPRPQTTTAEEPALDVRTLSDDEWDALPESTKARLRGDFG